MTYWGSTVAHEVFISYARGDQQIATQVCVALEDKGIRCWMAPRNALAGKNWDEQIVEALSISQVAVLIWSSSSDVSPQVKREVTLAVSKGISVLPFRIENVPLKSLEYFLSIPHWLDASTPPLEQHLPHLVTLADLNIPFTSTLLMFLGPKIRWKIKRGG